MFHILCQWCGEMFVGPLPGTLTCSPVCSLEYFDHLQQVAAKRQKAQQRDPEERSAGTPFVDPERS